jgi:1-aminocyclopropane-1-carboxylate deaminase/D-cysteine desulfhydrase-like pyridoxal-dependent ACC family enzyme
LKTPQNRTPSLLKFKPTTDEYHFGGYGKVNQELALSISFKNNNIPLDPIYTGKMVLALWKDRHQLFSV